MKRGAEVGPTNPGRTDRAASALFRADSDLTFLLGSARADPYNARGNGFERVIFGNDFDGLSASQFAEIPTQSEAVLRAVDD